MASHCGPSLGARADSRSIARPRSSRGRRWIGTFPTTRPDRRAHGYGVRAHRNVQPGSVQAVLPDGRSVREALPGRADSTWSRDRRGNARRRVHKDLRRRPSAPGQDSEDRGVVGSPLPLRAACGDRDVRIVDLDAGSAPVDRDDCGDRILVATV